MTIRIKRKSCLCEANAAYVDGSARDGKAGFAVYYGDGHALNVWSACAGEHNVAELVAIYAAVRRHPRFEPLTVYSDSAAALSAIERGLDGRWSLGLVAALCALLRLRGAATRLLKVPGHANLRKHDVADALAARARDRAVWAFPMPDVFFGPRTFALFFAICRDEWAYLSLR